MLPSLLPSVHVVFSLITSQLQVNLAGSVHSVRRIPGKGTLSEVMYQEEKTHHSSCRCKSKTFNRLQRAVFVDPIARPHPSMSTDPRCVILLCAGHFGLTLTQVPVAMGGVDLLGHFGL